MNQLRILKRGAGRGSMSMVNVTDFGLMQCHFTWRSHVWQCYLLIRNHNSNMIYADILVAVVVVLKQKKEEKKGV